MYQFLFYFSLFFIYSLFGWIIEVLFTSIRNKRLTFRGFLIGPYLPIYGFASIVMIMSLDKFKDNFIAFFVMASLTAASLEYLTSFIMEKIFKIRWWDYSEKKYHLDGRICLSNTVLFGILGSVVMYLINPKITTFLYGINSELLIIFGSISLVIILFDNIISYVIISNLKLNLKSKDATEQVDRAVWDNLSRLARRVLYAFPNFKIND